MQLQVGVKIFLRNKEGNYLLLRRNTQTYGTVRGEWDIVGGRIEPGTHLIENLRREVREETQLEITSEPILIAAQDIIPNDEKHVVRLSYVGTTEGEPVLDTHENVEYRWCSIHDLKKHQGLDVYVEDIVSSGRLEEVT